MLGPPGYYKLQAMKTLLTTNNNLCDKEHNKGSAITSGVGKKEPEGQHRKV